MYLDDYICALCNENTEETLMHLSSDCTFANDYWNLILPYRKHGISSYDEICIRLSELPQDIALDTILSSCSIIWSVRNDKIFRNAAPTS